MWNPRLENIIQEYTTDKNVEWYIHFEKYFDRFKRLNIYHYIDTAILFLNI